MTSSDPQWTVHGKVFLRCGLKKDGPEELLMQLIWTFRTSFTSVPFMLLVEDGALLSPSRLMAERQPHLQHVPRPPGDVESAFYSPPDHRNKPEAVSQRGERSMTLLPCVGTPVLIFLLGFAKSFIWQAQDASSTTESIEFKPKKQSQLDFNTCAG